MYIENRVNDVDIDFHTLSFDLHHTNRKQRFRLKEKINRVFRGRVSLSYHRFCIDIH